MYTARNQAKFNHSSVWFNVTVAALHNTAAYKTNQQSTIHKVLSTVHFQLPSSNAALEKA